MSSTTTVEETKPTEVKIELLPEKKPEKQLVPVTMGVQGVQLTSLDEALRFSRAVVASGLAPISFKTEAQVFIAISTGAELGLTPMASLNSLVVINGKVGLYSETAFALIRGKGVLEDYKEEITGLGDERKATVTTKRKGIPTPLISSFSIAQAKTAGIYGRNPVWKVYEDRMLLARARGFNARDGYSDILKGIGVAEELTDLTFQQEKDGPKLAE